jgi:hypothetical protein
MAKGAEPGREVFFGEPKPKVDTNCLTMLCASAVNMIDTQEGIFCLAATLTLYAIFFSSKRLYGTDEVLRPGVILTF